MAGTDRFQRQRLAALKVCLNLDRLGHRLNLSLVTASRSPKNGLVDAHCTTRKGDWKLHHTAAWHNRKVCSSMVANRVKTHTIVAFHFCHGPSDRPR